MKRSFKVGFYIMFGVVNLGIFALGVYNINNIIKIYQYSEAVNLLLYHTSNMNNSMQKYFQEDTKSTSYYRTQKSDAVQEYYNYSLLAKVQMQQIIDMEIAGEFGIKSKIKTLLQNFSMYNEHFNKLTNLYQYKGYIDYGKEGAMRKHAHFLEAHTNVFPLEHILKLRRHEKDYLLRKQPIYIEKVYATLDILQKDIHRKNSTSTNVALLDTELQNYKAEFLNIVKANEQIADLEAQNNHLFTFVINPGLGTVVRSIKERKEILINNSIRDFTVLSIIFLISTLIIGYKINDYKNQNMEDLESCIKNMLRSDFDNTILLKKLSETPSLRGMCIYLQRLEYTMKRYRPCIQDARQKKQKSPATAFLEVVSKNFSKLI